MKKFLWFTLGLLFLFGGEVSAQDVVYLRNGSMIRGSVLEHEIGKSVKVQTQDGSIYIYPMGEVERIAKDNNPVRQRNFGTNDSASSLERHHGLDFNVDLGYHISTNGGSGSFFTQLGLGKRFTPTFYWGVGAGVALPVSDGGDPIIPITSDFRLYFPLNTSKLVLGGVMRLGYAFNTADDMTVGKGKYQQTVEQPNYVMVQVLPTLTVPISPRTDFNVGIGYTHMIATGGGSGSGAVTVSAGFNFGRPLSFTPKPPRPILERGIQLSLDLGVQNAGGFGMASIGFAASYQFNPHLAAGLGFGCDDLGFDFREIEIKSDSDLPNFVAIGDIYRLFARGVYRFFDKKLSPIAACDIGIRFFDSAVLSLDDPDYSYPGSHFFVAPAVGGSLRMGSNSYLSLKAGYHLEKDLSGWLVNLGFTHTFGWGFGKK